MNWKLFNQPLGVAHPIGTPKKEIAWFVPLIMAAASAATSAYGAKKSADANKKAQGRLDSERSQTEAERMRAKNQKWGDTARGINTMRIMSDEAQRELSRIQGAAAMGGATDAAVASEKEQLRERQAEVLADANADFEDRKEVQDVSYRQQLSGLNQQQMALDQAKGQAIAQAASGVSSALMQGAIQTFGGTKLGQKWFGTGSPGGGGVTPAQQGTQLQNMGANNNLSYGNDYFANFAKNYKMTMQSPLFQKDPYKFFGV